MFKLKLKQIDPGRSPGCEGLVSIPFSIKTDANRTWAESGLGGLGFFHLLIQSEANLDWAESGLGVLGFCVIVNSS